DAGSARNRSERLFDIAVLLFDKTQEEHAVAQSQHPNKSQQLTQNQNNLMSDDPGDGSRKSDRLGAADKGPPHPGAPEDKPQHDEKTLEAFGEEGAGIAAKE
ncbi:MAG: hypothetical protein ACXW2T_11445, partial [Allosphingosinicella sp.]